MSKSEKFQRLITIRNKYLKKKQDAKKAMEKGNLKGYLEKLTDANDLRNQFSAALHEKG